jgi:hypothetical protein
MTQTKKIQQVLGIITILGAAIYIAKSIYFAHSVVSIGDEGAYLYKGLVFARGEFAPFEEYGYWTNKAPLAFLIPGYAQDLFGAGLREARYVALAVSFLMLGGIWVAAMRLGGPGWGAAAVWVYALSDANTSIYSQALSQGLVACMLAWMLVFVLGENRPRWQIFLGSILAVLIVMTRQNMIVLLPLSILYIFWNHGRSAGWSALITSGIFFLGFHALYWPNILQLWAPWLPDSLTPFLNDFRPFAAFGYDAWDVENFSRIQSVATGIQHHFFILCGFACALVLFPGRGAWKNQTNFKTAIFLGAAFTALVLMHTWASLFNQFCIQCFSPYQMFYTVAGFLFIVIVFSNGAAFSTLRTAVLVIILLSFASGFGLYYFQRLGTWALTAIQFPRVNRLFSEGELAWATLGDILTFIVNVPLDGQKRIGAALTGFLVGLLLLIVFWMIRRFGRSQSWIHGHASLSALNLFLILGVILPPALNTQIYSMPCSMRFLSYYEAAGRSLSEAIPPGSLVYWKGSGRHVALMLYVEDIRLFPPQITAGAGYVRAGDPDRLLRFGLFNDEMDLQWRESADFFIIWDGYPNTNLSDFQNDDRYEAVPYDMGSLNQCEDVLHLFRRRL